MSTGDTELFIVIIVFYGRCGLRKSPIAIRFPDPSVFIITRPPGLTLIRAFFGLYRFYAPYKVNDVTHDGLLYSDTIWAGYVMVFVAVREYVRNAIHVVFRHKYHGAKWCCASV